MARRAAIMQKGDPRTRRRPSIFAKPDQIPAATSNLASCAFSDMRAA